MEGNLKIKNRTMHPMVLGKITIQMAECMKGDSLRAYRMGMGDSLCPVEIIIKGK